MLCHWPVFLFPVVFWTENRTHSRCYFIHIPIPDSMMSWALGMLIKEGQGKLRSLQALCLGEGGLDWPSAREFTGPPIQQVCVGSPSQAPGSSTSSLGSWRKAAVLGKQKPDSWAVMWVGTLVQAAVITWRDEEIPLQPWPTWVRRGWLPMDLFCSHPVSLGLN